MQTEEKPDKENRDLKIARLLNYFGVIMAIFYFIMGISIAFLPLFEQIPDTPRYLFGSMLIVYGIFRFYRQLKRTTNE